MNKLATVAAFALLAFPFTAQADQHGADHAAPSVTEVAPAVVEAKEVTLKDGTKVVIEGDMVSVVGADGAKTAAPDGEHELADGTKVTVKEGKLVPAVAVETPAVPAAEKSAY